MPIPHFKTPFSPKMSSDSGEKKTPITATAKNHHVKQEQEQHLPCPRCDSINTKFCYYNNYNFSQPRHFCKSCRRYWTHGGTLRDIPVGGATRKNAKRSRLSTAPVSSTSISTNNLLIPFTGDHSISGGSFTSLLSTSQNHHHGFFGFDQDLSFGVGRTFWPFNGGHAAVGGGGITWQMEIGGDGGGDSFDLPELAISTQGNAMKSPIN